MTELQFVKGENLILADTLSRAVPKDEKTTNERCRIFNINMYPPLPLPPPPDVPDKRLDEIMEATGKDHAMTELISVISNGWPGNP